MWKVESEMEGKGEGLHVARRVVSSGGVEGCC